MIDEDSKLVLGLVDSNPGITIMDSDIGSAFGWDRSEVEQVTLPLWNMGYLRRVVGWA